MKMILFPKDWLDSDSIEKCCEMDTSFTDYKNPRATFFR